MGSKMTVTETLSEEKKDQWVVDAKKAEQALMTTRPKAEVLTSEEWKILRKQGVIALTSDHMDMIKDGKKEELLQEFRDRNARWDEMRRVKGVTPTQDDTPTEVHHEETINKQEEEPPLKEEKKIINKISNLFCPQIPGEEKEELSSQAYLKSEYDGKYNHVLPQDHSKKNLFFKGFFAGWGKEKIGSEFESVDVGCYLKTQDTDIEQIFLYFSNARLKTGRDKNYYYIYNEKIALWEKVESQVAKHFVMKILIEGYKKIISVIDIILQEDRIVKDELLFAQVEKQREKAEKCRNHVSNVAKVSGVMDLLKAGAEDIEFLDKLDHQPGFIPIKGKKVLNLRNGKVFKREKENGFTREIKITYNPNPAEEDLQKISNFLHQIMVYIGEDGQASETITIERVISLLVILGYSITAEATEQIFLFLYNQEGSAGKSALMKLIKAILGGDFFYSPPKELILKGSRPTQANDALRSMKDKLVIAFNELEKYDKLNEAQLRTFTGDEITARGIYEKLVSFDIVGVMFILLNEFPTLSECEATTRRIRVIHFLGRFVTSPNPLNPREFKINAFTERELSNEKTLEAFLYLIVEGAKRWYANGKKLDAGGEADYDYTDFTNQRYKNYIHPTFEKDKKELLEENKDLWDQYVEEHCLICSRGEGKCKFNVGTKRCDDASHYVPFTKIKEEFDTFCGVKAKPWSDKKIGLRLKQLSCDPTKKDQVRVRMGIQIIKDVNKEIKIVPSGSGTVHLQF